MNSVTDWKEVFLEGHELDREEELNQLEPMVHSLSIHM